MSEPLSLDPASVGNTLPMNTEEIPEPDGGGGPGGAIPVPVWASGLSAERIGAIQWRPVAALRPCPGSKLDGAQKLFVFLIAAADVLVLVMVGATTVRALGRLLLGIRARKVSSFARKWKRDS